MSESVKQKAAKGILWTLAQRFSGMGIQFISGVVLARLLMPEDYGAIGMLLIFMVVAEAFMDGGFGTALIQKKDLSQEDLSTIFWWNIVMALLLCSVIWLFSPMIAGFYRMPILCKVLRVQSIVLVIHAFSLVQANLLRKNFSFKILTIANLIASVVSLVVTIILAYHGWGVWSLVAQNILMAFIPAVFFWGANKWRPSFVFSRASFGSLFSFGIFMFFTHIINEVCNNIQGLLIGRFYSAALMGFYTKARNTEKIASSSITQALQQVTFPLYAALQDDKDEIINVVKKLTEMISFAVFPIMFCLILVAKPVFLLLYSDRWVQSIPYFQVFCLLGLSGCLQAINSQTIAAIGKSKQMFVWTVVKRVLGLLMIFVGLIFWGIWGLVWASVIHNWIVYLINVALVSKYVGYRFDHQLLNLFPALLLSVICFGLTFFIGEYINCGMYVKGIVQLVLFWGVYLIFARIFKLDAFILYQNKIKCFVKKS